MTKEYQKESVLRDLYHRQRLSSRDIAERFGVNKSTILDWMRRNGIERRERAESHRTSMLKKPASLSIHPRGYEYWKTRYNGDAAYVYVHRLLAVAEYGFDEVASNVVHHKNNIEWDNRPENLEVMGRIEHHEEHAKDRDMAEMGRKSVRAQYEDPNV